MYKPYKKGYKTMKKAEYIAHKEKMSNAIVQWMITKNPPEYKIEYAMRKLDAVCYHWFYQVTDWDNYDLFAFRLMENSIGKD